MNRINPFYIVAMTIALILFLIFKIGTLREQLDESTKNYTAKKEMAAKLVKLKNLSASKAVLIRYVKNIQGVHLTQTSMSVILKAKSLDRKTIDKIMAKVLNNAYWIKKISIKKIDNQTASLDMEIVW